MNSNTSINDMLRMLSSRRINESTYTESKNELENDQGESTDGVNIEATGKIIYQNNVVENGSFFNLKLDGNGIRERKEPNYIFTFDGKFMLGHFDRGKVMINQIDKNIKYEWYGTFISDCPFNGKGVWISNPIYPNDPYYKFEGEIKCGFPYTGKGSIAVSWKYQNDWHILEGEFNKGNFVGEGCCTNEKYLKKGELSMCDLNGKGELFHLKSTGTELIKKGTFNNNVLVNGDYYFKGNLYRGNFINEYLEGDGEIHYSNGIIFNGIIASDIPTRIGSYECDKDKLFITNYFFSKMVNIEKKRDDYFLNLKTEKQDKVECFVFTDMNDRLSYPTIKYIHSINFKDGDRFEGKIMLTKNSRLNYGLFKNIANRNIQSWSMLKLMIWAITISPDISNDYNARNKLFNNVNFCQKTMYDLAEKDLATKFDNVPIELMMNILKKRDDLIGSRV